MDKPVLMVHLEFSAYHEVLGGVDSNGADWWRMDVSGTLDEHPDCEFSGCQEKGLAVYWLCIDGGETYCEDHIQWAKSAQEQWDQEVKAA